MMRARPWTRARRRDSAVELTIGGRITWRMAARLSRLVIVLALTAGVVLPSPASPAVVCPPTSQKIAAAPVPARRADLANAGSYFEARYLRVDIGRFQTPGWSPRPRPLPYAHRGHPQTLNMSYVTNNPLNRVGPLGHNCFTRGVPRDGV